MIIDLVILILWVAFWIYWVAASVGVKTGHTRWGQFAGIRVVLVLLVLLLVRGRVLKENSLVAHGPWFEGIGLAVFLLGLALAVWARLYIGRNWGMPMTRKEEPELVTTGPYKTIRHPIYTGIIIAMVGTALAVSLFWFIAVGVLGAYFIYSATREERYMTEQFPEAYPAYKGSTKMLVPFIF
jgi:protein-S-isoprenylcysteine O-methyltransferase Ste14